MKSHKPTKKEQEWMDKIQDFGCVICQRTFRTYSPAEIHHIEGKTAPGSHLLTIPLCYAHHRGGEDNLLYTSRHPFKKKFEKRYGSEYDLLNYLRLELDQRES